MVIAYTTKRNISAITEAVSLSNEALTDYVFSSNQTISETLISYAKLHPDIMLLDVSDVEEEEYKEISRNVRSFHIMSEATRIIVISTTILMPGNQMLSSFVDTGVRDIVVEDDLLALPGKIASLIMNPAPYRAATRWQGASEDEATEGSQVKEIIKVVTKTETVVKHLHSKLILVANLTNRAGSSFVALNLARYLAQGSFNTSLLELPSATPMLFRMARLDILIPENYDGQEVSREDILATYASVQHEIVDGGVSFMRRNMESNDVGNLSYYVIDPSRENISSAWTVDHSAQLLKVAAKSTFTVVDVGKILTSRSVEPLITDADAIICLIEPLVSEWMHRLPVMDLVDDLVTKGYPITYVINRVTSKAHVAEIEEYYKRKAIQIPFISPELIQASINEGRDLTQLSKELTNALADITKKTIGAEFVPTGKRKLFKGSK
jgi:hypothetical protein